MDPPRKSDEWGKGEMTETVGVGLSVLAALCLAVQALAIRAGTTSRDIVGLLAVVFGVNIVVLLPVAAVVTGPAHGLTVIALGAFAAAGVLGSLLGRVCYFVGIARLGASRAEPLRSLLPLFALGAAVLVLGEVVTPTLLAGVVLLIVGGVAVTTEARASPTTARGRQFWIDVSFPLASALLYGIDPVVTKIGLAEGTTGIVGVAVRAAAAAAAFAAYLGWRAVGTASRPSIPLTRWTVLAGVANTGYLLSYYAALERAPVVVVTPVMGVSTLFVVAGAAVFFGQKERVTLRLAAAAAVVVLGVVVVARG